MTPVSALPAFPYGSPVNPASSASSATSAVQQTAQIRKMLNDLRADLNAIQTVLDVCDDMPDALSHEIRQWHANFTRALKERGGASAKRESDEERLNRILSTQLEQMQEMLRDPLTNTPLDREAILGSDGETYGFKALCLAIAQLPATLRNRSPLHPNDPAIFTKRNHPLARHMVGFLEKWHALEPSPELETDFNTFFNQTPLPDIPETPLHPPHAPRPPHAPHAPLQAGPAALPHAAAPQAQPRMMTLADLNARDAALAASAAHAAPAPGPVANHAPSTSALQARPRMMTLTDLRAEDARTGAAAAAAAAPIPPAVPSIVPPRPPTPAPNPEPEPDPAPDHDPEPDPAPNQAPDPAPHHPHPPFFNDADLANLLDVIDAQEEREAEEEQLQQEEEEAFEDRLADMIVHFREGMEEEFAPLRQRREDFAQEFQQAIQSLQEQNDQDIQQLQGEIDVLDGAIADVEHAIHQLPAHIHSLQREILEAEKEDLELQRDIQQLRVAVKERKKSSWGAIGAVFATVAICVGGTLLASYVAKYCFASAQAAMLPMNGGGQFLLRIPV